MEKNNKKIKLKPRIKLNLTCTTYIMEPWLLMAKPCIPQTRNYTPYVFQTVMCGYIDIIHRYGLHRYHSHRVMWVFWHLLLVTSFTLRRRGLVSKETVVLRRWGGETRKFGLSTELIM